MSTKKVGLLATFAVIIIIAVAVLNRTGTSTEKAAQSSAPLTDSGQTSTRTSRVPFVGCKSDGQSGPVEAPNGESKVVLIAAKAAQRLAYYESEKEFGVLAPRGWYCFGIYGSDGDALYVSPQPIDSANLFSPTWSGFSGPVIQLSREYGGTSGRFSVAKTIARVFPAHRTFVKAVIEEGIEPASSFPLGPYPTDRLIYRSNEIVEYQTPAHTEGLGTGSFVQRNANPISGVAILTGQDFDLLRLSVRLFPAQTVLTSSIVQQVEREAASQSKGVPHDAATAEPAPSPPPRTAKGYPVSEKTFVDAYVLANASREDLSEDQLAQLGHDEYQMGQQIDTQTLLLGGDLLNTRGKRAMAYLDNLYRQQHQTE